VLNSKKTATSIFFLNGLLCDSAQQPGIAYFFRMTHGRKAIHDQRKQNLLKNLDDDVLLKSFWKAISILDFNVFKNRLKRLLRVRIYSNNKVKSFYNLARHKAESQEMIHERARFKGLLP